MRARLRRPAARAWLGRGLALAGALAALLLFAVLVGARGGGTAGRSPDRLVIIDRSNTQLVALDAAGGARLATLKLAEVPNGIKYDEIRDRLYVLLAQSVIAVDPRTLQPAGRWDAPQPFAPAAGMALDSRGGRLYVAQPGGVVALALDAPEIAVARTYELGQQPGALALCARWGDAVRAERGAGAALDDRPGRRQRAIAGAGAEQSTQRLPQREP